MTESQYIDLRQLTKTLINLSVSQGKELKPDDIDTYINQAVMLSKLDCEEATKTRLYIDMEYEYKIVHNKGQAIFNDYDEKREWYSYLEYRTTSSGRDTRIISSTILLSAVLASTYLKM